VFSRREGCLQMSLKMSMIGLDVSAESRRRQRPWEAEQARRPQLDPGDEPGAARACRFDDVRPLPGQPVRGGVEGDQPAGLVPRELVAGLQPAAHERAHERMSGADTYRTVGRAAHLEQSALPARSVRMVVHERENGLRWTIVGDAFLYCDHRNPPLGAGNGLVAVTRVGN